MERRKSKAQRDYEADCAIRPNYHDGGKRKTWEQLDAVAQWSWKRPATETLAQALTPNQE